MRIALLAAAIVLAASSGAAQGADHTTGPAVRSVAPVVVLHDGPGDVWTFSDDTVGYEPAAQQAADVLRARITHGAYAVTVRMVFDDLRRENITWYYCDVHTPGATSWFILEAKRGPGRFFQDVDGEWVRVPGITHDIDYASDVVTLRIPRTLLGQPPWVRVRLRNELGLGGGVFFTDNPMTAGPRADFTPRLPPR